MIFLCKNLRSILYSAWSTVCEYDFRWLLLPLHDACCLRYRRDNTIHLIAVTTILFTENPIKLREFELYSTLNYIFLTRSQPIVHMCGAWVFVVKLHQCRPNFQSRPMQKWIIYPQTKYFVLVRMFIILIYQTTNA